MNAIGFVVSLGLFVGGLLLMGYAFTTTGYELAMFAGGLAAATLGILIPIHLLRRLER